MSRVLFQCCLLLSLLTSPILGAALNLAPRQTGGFNITVEVLGVFNAISQPKCNATEPCQVLAHTVIPRCLKMQGDPGCFCGQHDPVHYCAICMSNPSDNTTTPDQTQMATISHANFHTACGAYETFLNASVTASHRSSMTGSATSTVLSTDPALGETSAQGNSKSSNTGAIAGAVVGGIVALGLLGALTFLIRQRLNLNLAAQWIQHARNTTTGQSQAGHGRASSFSSSPEMKATNSPPPLQLSPPPNGLIVIGAGQGSPPTYPSASAAHSAVTSPSGQSSMYGLPSLRMGGGSTSAGHAHHDLGYDTRML